MVQRQGIRHQTYDQRGQKFDSRSGCSCITTPDKLFAPTSHCHQGVQFVPAKAGVSQIDAARDVVVSQHQIQSSRGIQKNGDRCHPVGVCGSQRTLHFLK